MSSSQMGRVSGTWDMVVACTRDDSGKVGTMTSAREVCVVGEYMIGLAARGIMIMTGRDGRRGSRGFCG
jgi:hypothetical protein